MVLDGPHQGPMPPSAVRGGTAANEVSSGGVERSETVFGVDHLKTFGERIAPLTALSANKHQDAGGEKALCSPEMWVNPQKWG